MGEVVAIGETPELFDEEWATFENFWHVWPKRVARKEALRAWDRMSSRDREDALIALLDWRRVWAGRGDYQYTPNASTWLNGERWTDDLPPEFQRARQTREANTKFNAAQDRATAEKRPPPAEFKKLLEQLKAKR